MHPQTQGPPNNTEAAQTRHARKRRDAQRARRRQRTARAIRDRPKLCRSRLASIRKVLEAYTKGFATPRCLAAHVERVESEVEELEQWAKMRTPETQTAGATVRQALEFLRNFGHITTLDFSPVPQEHRHCLVKLLSLEHRWCYAAAGTTRSRFKAATGRTGAR